MYGISRLLVQRIVFLDHAEGAAAGSPETVGQWGRGTRITGRQRENTCDLDVQK